MDAPLNKDSSLTADPLAKAEGWLSTVANQIEKVWDQEALVYLRSRGQDCHDQVTALKELWKATIAQSWAAWADEPEPNTIVEISCLLLRDFWRGTSPEEYSFEAIMWRTADWCEMVSFDLWRRLVGDREDKLPDASTKERVRAAYWLFNMLRSDYAIELIPEVLNRFLEAIRRAAPKNSRAWVFDSRDGTPSVQEHLAYASVIAFAEKRLTSNNSDPMLVDQALEAICKHQHGNGAWSTLTTDAEVSAESTAMALHAVALAQPTGWERVAV